MIELIGFDARMKPDLYSVEWPDARRESYLIDPTVPWPWSVDPDVWPSIFNDPEASKLREDPLNALLIEPDLADFRQEALGLWSTACGLRNAVERASRLNMSVCIAIELVSPKGAMFDPDWRDRLRGAPACEPTTIDWHHEGWDVADIDFCSGLSNMGWLDSERAHLRNRWLDQINVRGLLSNVDDAGDFARDMNERAPEHSPFFVFRLSSCPWDEI